ncbi:MAG: UDP-N-acetylglucosamine 1-carboxyvinyltransferase [Streptosporangiales bacterium]|nr:UDP-N-acetylglucosamine 1-carboxyvinyltransferase [Streptosporangiales bacterium]
MPRVERFRVEGSARLAGEVQVVGAKNSVLKLMAATLLAEGTTHLESVPDILDVQFMSELLEQLGCETERTNGSVRITVPARPGNAAEYELVRRLRASICVLGPLVARTGEARVALPGGDAIGSRGLDLHIAGLERLGATIESEHGYLIAKAPHGLTGATVVLDFPSVGATETILMASVLADGRTVIDNAAREPEIVDIIDMLQQMGAKIGGAGTSMIEVEGVPGLSATRHVTTPDRIVASTFAFGGAMTGGDVLIRGARGCHMEMPLEKLTDAGATITVDDDTLRVVGAERPRAIDVVTLPYPGFPTDLQPLVIALNAVASGSAMITENVFEARFMFVNEMIRLGAEIHVDGHHAAVRGRERLSGAPVQATDIRAGAGLVLAGLVAEGVTTVGGAFHIDRGYPRFVDQLVALGADVSREPDPHLFP